MKSLKIANYPRRFYLTTLQETPGESLMEIFQPLSENEEDRVFTKENFENALLSCFNVMEKKTRNYGILIVIDKCALVPNDYSFSEVIGTISHETIHIINKIFNIIGQDWDTYNDEVEAYLAQYISEEISKYLIEENIFQQFEVK